MSSRGRCQDGRGSNALGLVGQQPPEDLVAKAATEGADGLGLRVAGGHPLGEVVTARALALELGDRDPVESDIKLTIAAAVEAMADRVARPDWDRGRAVVAGEGGARAEATDAGRLSDELGRRQMTATGEGQERRRNARGERPHLALEAVDRAG